MRPKEFYKNFILEREIIKLCFKTLLFPSACDLISKLENLLPTSKY